MQSETDSTCRSQNLALDDFKATSPMKSKMNLCLLDVPKSNTDSHAKRKSVGTELLSSTGNGMILLRFAGGIKFPTLFREHLKVSSTRSRLLFCYHSQPHSQRM